MRNVTKMKAMMLKRLLRICVIAAIVIVSGVAALLAGTDKTDDVKAAQQIDKFIDAELRKKKIKAAVRATDEELLRRVTIDLNGTVPTPAELESYLADKSKDKFTKKVTSLLASPAYAENWTAIYSNLLVGRKFQGNAVYKSALDAWLMQVFTNNMAYDKMVYQLITASGLNSSSGAANFILRYDADPLQLAAKTSSLFLGLPMKCAQCHNHPNEKTIKQTDFYGLAAYFAKTHKETAAKVVRTNMDAISQQDKQLLLEAKDIYDKYQKLVIEKKLAKNDDDRKRLLKAFKDSLDVAYGKKIELKRPMYIMDDANGDVAIEKADSNGKISRTVVMPHLLGSPDTLRDADGVNRREAFASLVTATQNPYFAKATVNRVWAHFFGRGFVEPLDDFVPDADILYPNVLDFLTDDFVKHNYDLKHLMTVIVSTDAYQRTSAVSEADRKKNENTFAFQRVRPLSTDELFRILTKTLDLETVMGDKKDPTKFANYKDGFFRRFLTVFGNDEMEEVETFTGTIPQALTMQYSNLAKALSAKTGIVARIVTENKETEKQIELLYAQFLSRKPTAEEQAQMKTYIETYKPSEPKSKTEAQENIAWALMNSAEYITNH
jgi:hypothetical protein